MSCDCLHKTTHQQASSRPRKERVRNLQYSNIEHYAACIMQNNLAQRINCFKDMPHFIVFYITLFYIFVYKSSLYLFVYHFHSYSIIFLHIIGDSRSERHSANQMFSLSYLGKTTSNTNLKLSLFITTILMPRSCTQLVG